MQAMRGLTQRGLGKALGFPEKADSVRVAQYESGTRSPKPSMIIRMANVLNVSPYALRVPSIENTDELMHMLFALEDKYGFCVEKSDDTLYLHLRRPNSSLCMALNEWHKQTTLLKRGEIAKAEYDQWRYSYTSIIGGGTS